MEKFKIIGCTPRKQWFPVAYSPTVPRSVRAFLAPQIPQVYGVPMLEVVVEDDEVSAERCT